MNKIGKAVSRFIEINTLRTMSANNVNRDFKDAPKDVPYGLYRRARWSSAAIKKPLRRELNGLPEIPCSYNTTRVADEIQERLEKSLSDVRRDDISWTSWAVAAALVSSKKKGAKPAMNTKRCRQTAMAVNIADNEVERLAEIAVQNWKNQIGELASKVTDAEVELADAIAKAKAGGKKRKGKGDETTEEKVEEKDPASTASGEQDTDSEAGEDGKKPPVVVKAEKKLEAAKQALFDVVKGFVGAFKRGTKAASVLCFGRFLAKDQDPWQDDPAVQIADAMGVNVMRVTPDSWSQLDELSDKYGDDAQSNNLGTRYITSDCMYGYASINVEMLLKGYEGDVGLTRVVIESLLWGIVRALPGGRQNTHAAYPMPSMIFVTAHSNHQVNLASAFERPVEPTGEHSLSTVAAGRLDERWGFLRMQLKDEEVSTVKTFVHCDDPSARVLKNLSSSRHQKLQDMIREVSRAVLQEGIDETSMHDSVVRRNGSHGQNGSVKKVTLGEATE